MTKNDGSSNVCRDDARFASAGASTLDVSSESSPAMHISRAVTYGLGVRVPMIVYRLEKRRGVKSEVFDHNLAHPACGLRVNNGLIESNIPRWRRADLGDSHRRAIHVARRPASGSTTTTATHGRKDRIDRFRFLPRIRHCRDRRPIAFGTRGALRLTPMAARFPERTASKSTFAEPRRSRGLCLRSVPAQSGRLDLRVEAGKSCPIDGTSAPACATIFRSMSQWLPSRPSFKGSV